MDLDRSWSISKMKTFFMRCVTFLSMSEHICPSRLLACLSSAEHVKPVAFLYCELIMQVKMTLLLAVFSVPINTVWGIIAAIQITRNEFWGKTFVMSMLDLPFSISPVVTGTAPTGLNMPLPMFHPYQILLVYMHRRVRDLALSQAVVSKRMHRHAGLMLVLLYGREGWFSPVLRAAGFNVVFAFPGKTDTPTAEVLA